MFCKTPFGVNLFKDGGDRMEQETAEFEILDEGQAEEMVGNCCTAAIARAA